MNFADDSAFFEGAESRSTDVESNLLPVDDDGLFVDIRLEDFAGLSLRERDIVSVHFSFTANFTDGHVISPLRY